MPTEEELIDGCRRQQRQSQRLLYERLAGRMLAVSLRYARGRFEAEDALQEAFIQVFDKIGDFRRECPLEQWVKRIVINAALKQDRSLLYRYPAVDVDDLGETTGTESPSLANCQLADLLAMVQALPPRCRVVFSLYAIEGYAHAEIAQLLDVQEGTSKSQYARARQLLQGMLEEKIVKSINRYAARPKPA